MEAYSSSMEMHTLEDSGTASWKAKEPIDGRMALSMKDRSPKIQSLAKGNWDGLMEATTPGLSPKANEMDMESTFALLINLHTKELGAKELRRAKDYSLLLMEPPLKENSEEDWEKEAERWNIHLEINMKDLGSKIKKMEGA